MPKVDAVFRALVSATGERSIVYPQLAEEEAVSVQQAIDDLGYESVSDVVNAGLEGIRLNYPEDKNLHRDYYVRWANT